MNNIRLLIRSVFGSALQPLGAILLEYTFDLKEDEPKLDADWIKEDYADPTKMENGKLETYEWGVRLKGSLIFYMDNPSLNIEMWKTIIDNVIAGNRLYLCLKGNTYHEVYLTPESRRSYMDGFWGSVYGKLDFIGINLLKEIPKEF